MPSLYVREVGSGPRTVVLLHGFSDHGGTWCKVEPALAERYRVLVVDLPGFGRSSNHWAGPVLDHYVDVLDDLLAEIPEPVSFVGNSLGAVTSRLSASYHPSRVYRVARAVMPGRTGIPRLWTRGAQVPAAISRALALPVPAPVMQRAIGALYARAAMHRPERMDSAVRAAFNANYATRGQIDTMLAVGRMAIGELGRLPIPAMVHALDMPALLIWGAHDRLTPAHAARRVSVGSTRRVVVIADEGHWRQLAAPRAFLAAVLPFLE